MKNNQSVWRQSRTLRHAVKAGSAFTLIELLVAIGIIITLSSIAWVAFAGKGTTARIVATETTIQKINSQLKQRLQEFERLDFSDRAAQYQSTSNNNLANYPDKQAVRIAFEKIYLQLAFPQNAQDFTSLGGSLPTAIPQEIRDKDTTPESSELLYALLTTQGTVFGVPNTDLGEFTAEEIGDTDGDGLLEFIDSWGRPIRFYRWPTRLVRPDQDGDGGIDFSAEEANPENILDGFMSVVPDTESLNRDPDDAVGRLQLMVDRIGSSVWPESLRHTLQTYHTFLIVSAGPDEELGLFEPEDTTNFGHLAQPTTEVTDTLGSAESPLSTSIADNITNLKLGN